MSFLTPHVAFDATETAQSFAARLSAFHTGLGPEVLLRDLDISVVDLDIGKPKAIHALARVSQTDKEALMRNTPVHVDRTTFFLRGHRLAADFFVRPRVGYCPACVQAQDGHPTLSAWNRKQHWTWKLDVVRTCPEHGLPLVRRGKPVADEGVHPVLGAPATPSAVDAEIAARAARPVSPLQAYVVARLEGASGPRWLEEQPLDDVVRASELLGAVRLFGTDVDFPGLTDDQRDEAGACGYGCLVRGEQPVYDALAEIYRDFRYTGSKPGAQKVFGTLFKRIDARRGRSYGHLKPILRKFIIENFALEAGALVLGERLEKRLLHTTTSLAAEQKLDHRTLRHLLVSRGLLAEDAQAHQAFDADEGRLVAKMVQSKVTVTGLPKALGCSRPLADQILAEGILGPLATGNPHGKGHARKAVFLKDVEALVVHLERAAVAVETVPTGMVAIAKAAEKAKCPAIDILHLILGGYLSNVMRVGSGLGVSGLRVDADEARFAVSLLPEGLSPVEASRALGIPISTGWALVERGVLSVEKVTTPAEDHKILRACRCGIERFEKDLTTGGRLAGELDLASLLIERILRHARVRPAFSWKDVGIDIFRKVDVERISFR